MSMFKVGDKVRCVEGQENNKLYEGETYTVDGIHTVYEGNPTPLITVEGNDNQFFEFRFELVEEAKKYSKEPKFEVGDKVVCAGGEVYDHILVEGYTYTISNILKTAKGWSYELEEDVIGLSFPQEWFVSVEDYEDEDDDYYDDDDSWEEDYEEEVYKVVEKEPTPSQSNTTYIITGDTVTLCFNGETYTASNNDQVLFENIVQCIVNKDFENAITLIKPKVVVENWCNGLLTIANDVLFFNGERISNNLTGKIIDMARDGTGSFEPYAKCLGLLMEQENAETRQRVMDFVANGLIDIDHNGMVLAYKNVKDDYYDKRSGNFRNMVGDKPSMPRHLVDSDHNNTCSAGLHVCSPRYLRECWGTSGKNMLVKVHPKDFVAIPYDYKDSKARVCAYEVVTELTQEEIEAAIQYFDQVTTVKM